jgi:hypothetical protein
VLELLFEAGSDPRATNNYIKNAFDLHSFNIANDKNSLDVAETLQKNGVDINYVGLDGETPLFKGSLNHIQKYPIFVEKYL